jgi:hypothetical protein
MARLNVEFEVSHYIDNGVINYELHVENLDKPFASGIFRLRDLTHDLIDVHTVGGATGNGTIEYDGVQELQHFAKELAEELAFVQDLIAKNSKHKE